MRSGQHRETIALVALYVVVVAVGLLWIRSTETPALKTQLSFLTPLTLHVCLFLLIGGAWAARKTLARSIRGSGAAPWLLMVIAFLAVSIWPPRTHRIYYDEDIYQNVAQNILWRARAEMCNEGVLEHGIFECRAAEYNKEPNGFPFLLSLVFRFTGVREIAAHILNHALFSLGVLGSFWVAWLLWEDRWIAISAGLLYILLPQNLLWGATVAVEPGAAALTGWALVTWIVFLRQPGLATGASTAGAMAFAVQWRPESLLLIALAGASTFLLEPSRLRQRPVYTAALVVLLLLLPHLGHLWAVRGERWGVNEGGKFSWRYVPQNSRTNLAFYLEGRDHPRYFTLLTLLGIVVGRRWKEKALLLLWFALFFGVFIPFHAGSYRYGADVRFSLLSFMPLAVLGGGGARWLSGWLAGRRWQSRWVSALPLVAAVYFFSGYLPLVRSVGREAWAARADHDIARDVLERIPEQSIVLTHNPGMLQIMGQSAVQSSVASYEPHKVDGYFHQFAGGVYFHFNFWCNIPDALQNSFCNKILETYPTQVVEERSAGFYRYVIYRLMPKRDIPP